MSTAPEYSYTGKSVLIPEESGNYNQIVESLQEGLSDQATEEKLEINEVRESDDWIVIPSLYEEDELDGVYRYKIDDNIERRAVYIFDDHDGKVVIGDSAMVACAGDLGLAPLLGDSLK